MVNKPGRVWFPAERGLSLVAAISLAGGQSRQGDLKRVKLTRKNAKGEEVTTVIDVDAVLKGRASDLRLEPGDTVFVSDRADCDV
jgi:protein involved in polysaccharide export with SLBB domain